MDEHGHLIRGGDRVGLGEIRFSMVPEPSSGIVLAAGNYAGWSELRSPACSSRANFQLNGRRLQLTRRSGDWFNCESDLA
jgi:hypothetical protein